MGEIFDVYVLLPNATSNKESNIDEIEDHYISL